MTYWLQFILILLSTVLSTYAIVKQFQYINSLQKWYEFGVNKVAFVVHAFLLGFITATTLTYCILLEV